MAYFALFYHVVDHFVERRTPFRESHLAHAQDAAARGELVLAGDTALIVFRSESPDAARCFAETDPYVLNGLVQRWEVRPWNVVVGTYANPSVLTSKGGA